MKTFPAILNAAIPASPVVNSVNSIVRRAGGLLVSKSLVLAANNTTASMNAFQLTGAVVLKKLWAEITAVTTLANLTAGSFDLYDSTAAIQLTKADGDLSGFAVGSIIAKHAISSATWGALNAVAGVTLDSGVGGPLWCEVLIRQKVAANTFVRFTYTTTDAPIAATLTMYAAYVPLGSGTLVAV